MGPVGPQACGDTCRPSWSWTTNRPMRPRRRRREPARRCCGSPRTLARETSFGRPRSGFRGGCDPRRLRRGRGRPARPGGPSAPPRSGPRRGGLRDRVGMDGRDGIPAVRFRANEIGSRILTRMTGHEVKKDGQIGSSPSCRATPPAVSLFHSSLGATEMLLKAARHVRRFANVPVRAIYDLARSHYPSVPRYLDHFVGGAVFYKVFETD